MGKEVAVRPEDGLGDALVLVVTALLGSTRMLLRSPRLLLLGAVLGTAWWLGRIAGLFGTALAIGVVGAAWRCSSPRSFRRLVSGPFARGRRRSRYRRSWSGLVAAHRLSWTAHPRHTRGGASISYMTVWPVVPKLERIETGEWRDRLTVRMLPAQTPAEWEDAAEGIGHALGARSARVRVAGPGRLWLDLAYGDPLAATVPALPVPDVVNLDAIPVGRDENGEPWCLQLTGNHVLVAGVTGSGKGSVVWSILRGIAPAVAGGLVQVHALDPKGGMELGPGRPLFARFAADSFEEMADLLDDSCELMRSRARRLAGFSRVHVPTAEEPLVLVVVDEVANLTAYLPDRKLRERITQSLSLLLTQGRAVGVCVVAALQDPRKEVLGFRNLFPTKVALRLDEPVQVDMVLGDGARDQGALCDQISESQPGVGYVRVDGVREPARVRASFVTDADIAAVCSRYGVDHGPGTRPVAEVA